MKLLPIYFTLIVVFACSQKRKSLDYPDISEIKSIELSRPDSATHGKMEEIKELSPSEIKDLIDALDTPKPLGTVKFKPDCYIVFTLNDNSNTRLKVTGGKIIKDYENDYSYEIKELGFLMDF